MTSRKLLRAFAVLWLTLATILLVSSIATVAHAVRPTPAHYHVAVLGTVEALGACLFMVPRLMRIGGGALLATIGLAAALHALLGEFRGDLVVYFVAVLFAVAHGPMTRSEWASAFGRASK